MVSKHRSALEPRGPFHVSTTIAIADLETVMASSWLLPPSRATRNLRVVLLLLRLLQLQKLRVEAENLVTSDSIETKADSETVMACTVGAQIVEAILDAPKSGRML